jgi:hypothetical protein
MISQLKEVKVTLKALFLRIEYILLFKEQVLHRRPHRFTAFGFD